MTTQHTPLPWKFDNHNNHIFGCRSIKGAKSGTHKQAQYTEIAETVGLHNDEEDLANAQFIVRACNSHDDLLEACQAALTVINTCVPVDTKVPIPGISPMLRDAIAKAQEEG